MHRFQRSVHTRPAKRPTGFVSLARTVTLAVSTFAAVSCGGGAGPTGTSPPPAVTPLSWIWISGSNADNDPPVYGTQSSPAASNVPGARTNSISWTDPDGNLWLFGGYGIDSQGNSNLLNDLWEYSASENTWVWVSGSKMSGASGVYGTRGAPSATNIPGARNLSVSWTDAAGHLWLFGGVGYANGVSVALNDLWEYNPSDGTWTWVSGSTGGGAQGVYGTQGAPSAGNVPGARSSAISWIDSTGNFWLFGG